MSNGLQSIADKLNSHNSLSDVFNDIKSVACYTKLVSEYAEGGNEMADLSTSILPDVIEFLIDGTTTAESIAETSMISLRDLDGLIGLYKSRRRSFYN